MKDALVTANERIASAVQMVNMLKSVNDTSLSDWKGVIGEELDQQREERRKHEEQVQGRLQQIEALLADARLQLLTRDSADELAEEIREIRDDLRVVAMQTTGTPMRSKRRAKHQRIQVAQPCPSCGTEVSYEQRPKSNSVKALECEKCGTRLVSRHVDEGVFELAERKRVPENITCPWCGRPDVVEVDNFVGSSEVADCDDCGGQFLVARARDEVRALRRGDNPVETPAVFEKVLERVRGALPSQPWPEGMHNAVAKELGIPAHVVYKAVGELIRRGVCQVQFDGELYVKQAAPRVTTGRGQPTADSAS